jgi:predicted ATP-binding protein involved in virulence
MKLDRLTVANFRGLEQIDLGFEADVTVVAGVNGAGKSGVLKVLAAALSQGMPSLTASQEAPLGLSDTDVQFGKSALTLSMALSLSGASVHVDINRTAPLDPTKAEALLKRRDELRFAIRETKKGSAEEQAVNDDLRLIENQLAEPVDLPTVRVLPNDTRVAPEVFSAQARNADQQPLAVLYSTNRLLSRLPPSLPRVRSLSVGAAYERALAQPEVSLNDFANWARVVASGSDRTYAARMFRQLSRAIRNFLPGVTRLRLHDTRPPRFSVHKQGSQLYLEQLSDGERGLLALVFDLTRRLAIANSASANPLRDGIALVLIDEIELHLHPKWQRDVIDRLRSTFPACQFVVTTHSPQVIGEVEARCVRLLSIQQGKVVHETPSMTLGADSNWILSVLMGTHEMNEDVERELADISSLIAQRQLEGAKAKLYELRDRVGNTEAVQHRVSTIERIERLGR